MKVFIPAPAITGGVQYPFVVDGEHYTGVGTTLEEAQEHAEAQATLGAPKREQSVSLLDLYREAAGADCAEEIAA